jgi:hypothetical protein
MNFEILQAFGLSSLTGVKCQRDQVQNNVSKEILTILRMLSSREHDMYS